MLTKTRTALITLIAAGSFATASVAPAVSQAARKIHHIGPSAKTKQGLTECQDAKVMMTAQLEAGAEALAEGDSEGATEHFEAARRDAEAAAIFCTPAAESAPEATRPPVAEVITTPPPVVTPPVSKTPPVVVKVVRPGPALG